MWSVKIFLFFLALLLLMWSPFVDLQLSFPEIDTERQRESRTRVSLECQAAVRFAVFISYAEIYNELIYDLLEKTPLVRGQRRHVLKLAEDDQKKQYIKGKSKPWAVEQVLFGFELLSLPSHGPFVDLILGSKFASLRQWNRPVALSWKKTSVRLLNTSVLKTWF